MSNIYCSNCGTKHILGCKFCSNCGNSLGGFNNPQINKAQVSPRLNQKPQERELDEDGIPTTFVKPSRLSYEIERPNKNKYSGKELFESPPVDHNERQPPRILTNYKQLTKEELLAESLRECSSRPMKDIDES
jgi:hypothetical protein